MLDEPALDQWGDLSGGEQLKLAEGYSYLYSAVADLGARLGIHTCGALRSEFLDFPVDILSFDCLPDGEPIFNPAHQEAWAAAFKRGLAAVPGVFESVCTEPVEEAYRRGRALFERSGERLRGLGARGNILAAAGCGHANASLEWIERLYAGPDLPEGEGG